MQKIKYKNEDVWKDMMELPPSMWTRYAFPIYNQCDFQVSNMCDTFNMAIFELINKPIITLRERLKHYVKVRITKQNNLLSHFRGTICLKVEQTIEG